MSVNILAVIVAAVVNMILGALWYSPVLFGKQWMRMIGKSEKELKTGASKAYGVTFITALILAYILAVFLNLLDVHGIAGGLKTAFWAWLGFSACTTISDYLFAGRPLNLFAINVGYYLVAMLLMSVVLTTWR